MIQCVLCPLPARRGLLCKVHVATVGMSSITAEQIDSRCQRPRAAFIDMWGRALGVDPLTIIGRSFDRCQLAITHPTISLRHALLELHGDRWRLTDQGSRNGTTVDGRAARSHHLVSGGRVAFSEVGFYFVPWMPSLRSPPLEQVTPVMTSSWQSVLVSPNGHRLELLGCGDSAIVRAAWGMCSLSKRECQVLLALGGRLVRNTDFISWQTLAASVGFDVVDGADNIREVVHRLRRKLVCIVIQSKPGHGYRLDARTEGLSGT